MLKLLLADVISPSPPAFPHPFKHHAPVHQEFLFYWSKVFECMMWLLIFFFNYFPTLDPITMTLLRNWGRSVLHGAQFALQLENNVTFFGGGRL